MLQSATEILGHTASVHATQWETGKIFNLMISTKAADLVRAAKGKSHEDRLGRSHRNMVKIKESGCRGPGWWAPRGPFTWGYEPWCHLEGTAASRGLYPRVKGPRRGPLARTPPLIHEPIEMTKRYVTFVMEISGKIRKVFDAQRPIGLVLRRNRIQLPIGVENIANSSKMSMSKSDGTARYFVGLRCEYYCHFYMFTKTQIQTRNITHQSDHV